MAINAGHGTVGANERKVGMRVVEPGQVLPGFRGMAGYAAKGLSIATGDSHAANKLPLMNVFVAACATELIEVIERHTGSRQWLVALVTGHGSVTTGKREVGALVVGERVGRGLEGGPGVALFASIAPGRGSELALVLVLVTVNAEPELDLVASLFSGWDMAVDTLHIGVRKEQREIGLSMICSSKCRGGPAFDRVATLATASVGAPEELSPVRIGIVAVGAVGEGDGSLEVGTFVAGNARYRDVLAEQRKLCLRVVEGRGEGGTLPTESIVAGVASLLELAFVRVGVAGRAGGERDAGVTRLAIGAGCVALLAGSGLVSSGEFEARLGVVEVLRVDFGAFPI